MRWSVLLLFAALLFGCTKEEVKPEIKVESPPPVVAPKPQAAPAVKAKPLPPVTILVSEAIPAYQQVADELMRRLSKRAQVITLDKEERSSAERIGALRRDEYQQFVAIGIDAAQQVKQLAGAEDEVIFCQIFNYQDYDLVGPRSKGVAAWPGTAVLFSRWSKMSPGLKRVGVFTAPGLEVIIEAATREARKYGITLVHRVVDSDKELLFQYKQLAPSLQGLWLLPDNRVLSGRTIKELMSFSIRNRLQVAVFSEVLLRLGGLISITTSEKEIAEKVVGRLQAALNSDGVPGADLMLLQQGIVTVNPVIAKRYNLNYP